jgi:23S rRNA (guanosine2251-2'-O)-methyltransferase
MSYLIGIHAVESIVRNQPSQIHTLMLLEKNRNGRLEALLRASQEASVAVRLLSREGLDDLDPSGKHQGVIASVKQRNPLSEKSLFTLLETLPHDPLLLLLDGVQDPHNLGACLRSAEAAGVDAVIVPKDRAVGLTEVVAKVASGALEMLPFIQVTNVVRTLAQLKKQGLWVAGAAGESEQSIYAVNLKGPLVIAMGGEGKGLRRLTREHCDYLMRIPMRGRSESLNVSVATGVCLFEACRQREA